MISVFMVFSFHSLRRYGQFVRIDVPFNYNVSALKKDQAEGPTHVEVNPKITPQYPHEIKQTNVPHLASNIQEEGPSHVEAKPKLMPKSSKPASHLTSDEIEQVKVSHQKVERLDIQTARPGLANNLLSDYRCRKIKDYSRNNDTNLLLPNVLLIGAQKAASTAVVSWLSDSGGICKARRKSFEPKYYGKEQHFYDIHCRYAAGVHFYAGHYEHFF
jgi:hypothetical protein